MRLDLTTLSPDLFWDVPRARVDCSRHRRWLLERVLELGRWEDWLAVAQAYGDRELEALAPALRISARSSNFLQRWLERPNAR